MIFSWQFLTKFVCAVMLVSSCPAQEKKETRDDFKKYFDAFKVEGSFALYDLKKDSYLFCNEKQFKQELSRRVGGKRMKYWLDKAKYGNADTSGGIDKFWLSGGLRITPEQQIKFLVRLYKNDLPFSTKSIDIVKKIMIAQDTIGFVLRAKTGWSEQDSKNIGWYVGYLETGAGTYFFSTCIQCADQANPDFAKARREITLSILKTLKLL